MISVTTQKRGKEERRKDLSIKIMETVLDPILECDANSQLDGFGSSVGFEFVDLLGRNIISFHQLCEEHPRRHE